jgi:hypothetical protein
VDVGLNYRRVWLGRMSKVTQVYYDFVIPKNKCVKKKANGNLVVYVVSFDEFEPKPHIT